ncbi:hypothetical protein SEVIR_5G449400v4 [Setaria viridis]|uniref:Uncharacterized protein n=2 Tax=Setaria TaxID=4554 RepID=K3XMX6_SETIT|nr:hypothetical protein SETIT_5G443400v2 [Setaria italica]RCV28945.1 hypothetical protein SETIT_5G443400v2 [Setaria italica]TKW18716.1 hypothetical protein SEVIR_5G449400v2 [Setaria viridis]TKW18717.1 hypothetical protein SEVIR_5G449400v2 [Setaria viridis]
MIRRLLRAIRAAAVVELALDRHVRYGAPRVLLTGCKKAAAEPEGKRAASAASAWRRCARWRRRRSMGAYPWSCRAARTPPTDVPVLHLDPELQKYLAEFSPDDLIRPLRRNQQEQLGAVKNEAVGRPVCCSLNSARFLCAHLAANS